MPKIPEMGPIFPILPVHQKTLKTSQRIFLENGAPVNRINYQGQFVIKKCNRGQLNRAHLCTSNALVCIELGLRLHAISLECRCVHCQIGMYGPLPCHAHSGIPNR